METAEREEAEALRQETEKKDEAAAFAARLVAMRQECAEEADARRQQQAAEAKVVAASIAATAAVTAAAVEAAQRTKLRELKEIEAEVREFYSRFNQQHSRDPNEADLRKAANSSIRVRIERYRFLKRGEVPSALRGRERVRSQVARHKF